MEIVQWGMMGLIFFEELREIYPFEVLSDG
jgi:hypothetical protein